MLSKLPKEIRPSPKKPQPTEKIIFTQMLNTVQEK